MGLLKCVVKPTRNSHPRIIPLKSPLLGLGTVGAGLKSEASIRDWLGFTVQCSCTVLFLLDGVD